MSCAPDLAASPPCLDRALDRECREVMTAHVVTVEPEATVREVSRVLATHDIGAVLVIAHGDAEPAGWVRRVDIVDAPADASASEAIGEKVTFIVPNATVRSARYALALPNVTHLAVRRGDGGLPIGVITVSDVGDPSRPLQKE